MAKLNLNKFKENADRIIQEKSTQGLFSESQNKLVTLELELLRDSDFRVRLDDSNLEELSESIENFTQLEPITVAKHKNGYEILNGHARVEAIKLLGGDSALCVVINIAEIDAPLYPYLLNRSQVLNDFEIAYYVERLLASGFKEKTIQKKLGLDSDRYKTYNFEYNLFDVLKNSEIITYAYLKDIADIKNESMRDETLDHIVQKLISQTEIENYLTKVKENDLGSRFSMKTDGVKIKKNSHKTSIEIDERHLSFDEIRKTYAFIEDMTR
mgnify:CR=1 FL=1|jgi:hypothetical protein